MQVIRDIQPSDSSKRSVVTIGAYDGVHRGHQAVIGQVKATAQDLGCRSVVITFDKHPASVVRPESAPKLLTDLDQKLELLQQTRIDATLVVEFNQERSSEDPAVFVQRVLVDALHAQVIVVGEDFHFGFKRSGNVAMLRDLGKQFDFEVVPVKLIQRPDEVEEPVSSTSIRRALAGGQVEVATNLLGRAYEVRGVVVSGDKRGRTIGFPTANVEVPNAMCLPADGVYAGHFTREDGAVHSCAINLGRRPTFFEHADHSLLEAHLLDFDGDLYGEYVRVTFEHFLRSERKFEGLEAIKTQLQLDVVAARASMK